MTEEKLKQLWDEADTGDAQALFELGVYHLEKGGEGGNIPLGRALLEKATEAGNSEAAVALARSYISSDPEKALLTTFRLRMKDADDSDRRQKPGSTPSDRKSASKVA